MATNRFRLNLCLSFWEASLRLCVWLLGTVMNSRQPETGLITMGMSHCLCRLVFFVCLKSPCMTKTAERGQWLPAVKIYSSFKTIHYNYVSQQGRSAKI